MAKRAGSEVIEVKEVMLCTFRSRGLLLISSSRQQTANPRRAHSLASPTHDLRQLALVLMRRTERLAKRPVDPAVQKFVRIWQGA